MSDRYHLAIVGAGPAGLSAAGRAAYYDAVNGATTPSYVLLEGFSTFAKTIQKYQKGKHVMDEPGFLDLRSELGFTAGKREQILASWQQSLEAGINIRYDSEVVAIDGEKGSFRLGLQSGDVIEAEHIVFSIGTQGNPRALGVSGDAESDFVRYTLDDPADFKDETIIVVGAGDAAIENAIALSDYNKVFIINRRNEFSRAKDGNLNAVLAAINDKNRGFYCRYESSVAGLELPACSGQLGALILNTPSGEERIECHRIIARLGTVPPRKFVESCSIEISSPSMEAVPDVDRHYQSNVPGLYIIGALAGYPLIKQAMNQGYDVIEFIHGKNTKPADYPLLQGQFSGLPYVMDAEDVLDLYQQRVPMFRRMNPLAFRELIIESRIIVSLPPSELAQAAPSGDHSTHFVAAGEPLYRHGEFSTSFYTLVEGEVQLQLEQDGPWHTIKPGQFFGEMSLISGRPRQGDAVVSQDSILIETPRRIMVKLMNSNEEVRSGIDRVFVMRALQAAFRPQLSLDELAAIAGRVETCQFKAGEVLFSEGEEGECLHLIRSGTVMLTRGGANMVVAQSHSGELVGQLALMGTPKRADSATAAVRTETVLLRRPEFLTLVNSQPEHVATLQSRLSDTLQKSNAMASQPQAARAIGFLMAEGLGEATNALVIDETLCVGCDNCERACAETHNGISRLNRQSGASMAGLHVPVSCRHCELPHCMKDCPPDAIRRTANGEVFISDSCIGCGNCETNCPYGAIKLSYQAPKKPGLLSWLLFGLGSGPGEPEHFKPSAAAQDAGKKAVKCDACMGRSGGPACVQACPTGAALRLSPNQFAQLVEGR
ncbi:cyclic nucleotide-binding domain-containing protein [Parahaliea sp. F7430]|uniref:Cyclic nucleotide-binding domain-containing protein n=1 Tax=Sediminihaliea albiluteola TaxID=2758564 RepID=A0A7W2YI14_9GAMM|nr:cyclic nucleotide-binding domain-containing protein [Sediminihaliea albiluteola]MBA6411577.1 cyclic nucleotide-binding domain-containing protein [Sediminihaliea albiluteola]